MVNEIPDNYGYIHYYLNELLNDGIEWSEVSKDFIRYLVNNIDRIVLFKEASREGILISNSILGLHQAQKSCFQRYFEEKISALSIKVIYIQQDKYSCIN